MAFSLTLPSRNMICLLDKGFCAASLRWREKHLSLSVPGADPRGLVPKWGDQTRLWLPTDVPVKKS